jgi:formyl-CoA transferase/CoA:oxalate CoA-transferase
MEQCLEKIRVLDFSHALAGPYCTLLFSYYGADVYKVESPDAGEMGRTWGPPFTGGEASYFLGLNAGKYGLAIDMKKPEGIELCLRLAERCDVLLENFRPGTLERLGLGYSVVRARNPRLIYCAISGYGQNGPSRNEAAMDLILQASCGLMSVTGTPAGELVRCGHSVADITAGMFAMIGILLALRTRETTGTGQYIDVSMLDGMISAMSSAYANYNGLGISPRPMGSAFASIVPYRGYPTADRDLVIAVASDRLWELFCEAIEHPELAAHPGFATNADRVRNRDLVDRTIADIMKGRKAEEWIAIFQRMGIPHSPVCTLEEVVRSPQSQTRQMFVPVEHGSAGVFPVTGLPVKLSDTPGSIRGGAPALGQHTETVLRNLLDFSNEELASLRRAGVIPAAPE